MPASDVRNSARPIFLREFHFVSESSLKGVWDHHVPTAGQGLPRATRNEPDVYRIDRAWSRVCHFAGKEARDNPCLKFYSPWQLYTSFLVRGEKQHVDTIRCSLFCSPYTIWVVGGDNVVGRVRGRRFRVCVSVCQWPPCHTSYEHCSTLSQRLMYSCHLSIIMFDEPGVHM